MKFDGIDTQGYLYNQRDLRSTNTPYDGRLIHDNKKMYFGDGVKWVELATDQWSPTITLTGDVSGSGTLENLGDASIATIVNKYKEIPQGTIMLFGQASAPTGWTKLTNWLDTSMICINTDADGTSLASGGTYSPQLTHNHGISGGGSTGSAGAHSHGLSSGTVHSYTGGSSYNRVSIVTGISGVGDHTHSLSGSSSTGDGPIPWYQEVIVAQRD